MALSFLRKNNLSQTEAYFKRCVHFVAAGNVAVCIEGCCRICDGSRRFYSMMGFYAKRHSQSRPERESIIYCFLC